MKRNIILVGANLLLLPLLSFGAQQTWTGQISDNMCAANHQAMAQPGQKVNSKNCTLQCVKSGGKYVFVSNGRVFQIANQKDPDLEKHAGQTVELTGDLGSDNRITVAKVQTAR